MNVQIESIPKKDVINTSAAEIKRIFALQQKHRMLVKNTSAYERINKLKKLRDKLLGESDRLYEALAKDYSKPRLEADLLEMLPTIAEISEAIRNLPRWMRPKNVETPMHLIGAKSEIRYEARGSVLIIAPWNYPFQLTIGPMIGAIAAGNVMMIKPSEYTPHTSQFLQDIIADIFPEEEIAVIQGDHTVSTELLKLKFDHVFFTGSPNVGKVVMEAASKHLTSITLELGGKSPVIIDKAADMRDAAKKICWGKFVNAGQTCVAPDYILVPAEKSSEFFAGAAEALTAFYGSEAQRSTSPDLCHIVNKRHYNRLKNLFETAVKKGAKVEIGGTFVDETNMITPTILSHVDLNSEIMTEEIFGPLLPVVTYRHLDEAIELINSKEKPLALYIFSDQNRVQEKILNETSAGGTCVNDVVVHLGNPKLPFGGVNHSGIGNYHGEFGFKAFSHERSVFKQSKLFSATQMLYPPYNNTVIEFFQKMLRNFL